MSYGGLGPGAVGLRVGRAELMEEQGWDSKIRGPLASSWGNIAEGKTP